MADKTGNLVLNLFRQSYQAFDTLPDLLECGLRAIVEGTRSHSAEIALEPTPALGITEPIRVSAPQAAGPRASEFQIPLRYQDRVIGHVALFSERPGHYAGLGSAVAQSIGEMFAGQIGRHQIGSGVSARHGRDLRLVGTSEALARMDEFMEKGSASSLPVLILSERGSREERLAYSLHHAGHYAGHCAGARADAAFIEINCVLARSPAFELQLEPFAARSSKMAADIYFRGVEHLDLQLQYRLAEFMEGLQLRPESGVRVLASVNADLEKLSLDGRFCPALLWSFDYLQAHLPPLRRRREDIRPLAERFLRRHSANSRVFSKDALAVLESYTWPENVSEMERLIARLAVMCSGGVIGVSDFYRHAAKLFGDEGGSIGAVPAGAERRAPESVEPVGLVRNLLRKTDTPGFDALHPAMRRALAYLCSRSADPISVKKLAEASNVSSSHLAFLFRSLLGMSFKHTLALVRVERAKEMLAAHSDLPLADVAERLGFQEPRHFQRTFKRLVGCTPTDFRRGNAFERRCAPAADSSASPAARVRQIRSIGGQA
jgi:AraC-like DNA-binding protein